LVWLIYEVRQGVYGVSDEQNNVQDEQELPRGWVLTPLSGITLSLNSGFPSGRHNQSGLGVPHLRPMNISSLGDIDLTVTKYVQEGQYESLLEGDVLFNNTNSLELVGKTALIAQDTNWVWSNHMTRVRLPKNLIDPQYVAYFLHSLFSQGYYRARAQNYVNQASIGIATLGQVEIPLPPTNEQNRILEKLESLLTTIDDAVVGLEQAKEDLKTYRQMILKAAVEGELTREWREEHAGEIEDAEVLLGRILQERRERWEAEQEAKGRKNAKYEEPKAPDIENLPELPEGWAWAALPQLGELNRGRSRHRPRNAPELYGGQYPFVQTGDIRAANGIITTYTQTYSEEGLKQSRLWPTGTLCITIAANIAETAILGFDACFPDSVVGFIPTNEDFDVRIAEFFLRTIKADLEAYAPATAQKNINLDVLSNVAIPVPPKIEQEKIIQELESRLASADELESSIEAQLKQGAELRQAVLQQAFEGKLVPQDPNDEPASVLLERIREEKERMAKEAKEKRLKTPRKAAVPKEPVSLVEVLKESKEPLTPEELFRASEYDFSTVEAFYTELKAAVGHHLILEERKTPSSRDTLLRASK
jgi:type I restriction enzyme, S subunit